MVALAAILEVFACYALLPAADLCLLTNTVRACCCRLLMAVGISSFLPIQPLLWLGC